MPSDTTHLAVRIPVQGPIVVQPLDYANHRGLVEFAVGDPDASLDFIYFPRLGFQVAVGDLSLIDGSWRNRRAMALTFSYTDRHGQGYQGPLAGDVALLGVNSWGDYGDLPDDLLESVYKLAGEQR